MKIEGQLWIAMDRAKVSALEPCAETNGIYPRNDWFWQRYLATHCAFDEWLAFGL